MKNTIRKLSTVLLALVMIFAMSISTFAADQETPGQDTSLKPSDNQAVVSNSGVSQHGQDAGGDDAGKYGVYSPAKNTIRIQKEIVIFNTRGTGNTKTLVYLPNITYKYKIEPVTGIYNANATNNAKITDEYMLSASVRDGVESAIVASDGNLADLVYSNSEGVNNFVATTGQADNNPYVLTNNNGVSVAGYVDIAFQTKNGDNKTFTAPGVYRYKITESTADDARKHAGITNKGYETVRYLDVYVQNKSGNSGDLEIYGYAMYEPTSDTSNKDSFKARENASADVKLIPAKSNGFVSDVTDGNSKTSGAAVTEYKKDEEGVDIYETDNVAIVKKTTGAMGDTTNEFPFAATFTNSDITSGAKITYQKFENVAPDNDSMKTVQSTTATFNGSGVATIGSADSASATPALNDKDYIYAYGIPSFNSTAKTTGWESFAVTTVNFKEFNNTPDTYNVSAKYNASGVNVTSNGVTGAVVNMDQAKDAVYNTAQNMAYASKTITPYGAVPEGNAEYEYVEVTNKLNAISPTNVVMRFAPYLFILGGAMLLLFASRRRKAEQE